jgi:CRISPR-associated exonuclease Cas4
MFTAELRSMTEAAIGAARSAHERLMPGPIENARKCQACSLKGICLPQEMRFLQVE